MSDYTGEKLVHALLTLVPLQPLLSTSLDEESRARLAHSIKDLAKGTISHLLLCQNVSFTVWQSRLSQFVDRVQQCSTRREVLAAFAAVSELDECWCLPYFDTIDQKILREEKNEQVSLFATDEDK